MQDKNPLAHYSDVLSEAEHQSADATGKAAQDHCALIAHVESKAFKAAQRAQAQKGQA